MVLRHVKPGEPIRASLFNEMVDEIVRVRRFMGDNGVNNQGGIALRSKAQPKILYGELSEKVLNREKGKKFKPIRRNTGDDDWETIDEVERDLVNDYLGSGTDTTPVWLSGERRLMAFLPMIGRWFPMGFNWHIAKVKNAAIEKGAVGDITIWKLEEGLEATAGEDAKGSNFLGPRLEPNQECYAIWHAQAKRYYLIPPGGLQSSSSSSSSGSGSSSSSSSSSDSSSSSSDSSSSDSSSSGSSSSGSSSGSSGSSSSGSDSSGSGSSGSGSGSGSGSDSSGSGSGSSSSSGGCVTEFPNDPSSLPLLGQGEVASGAVSVVFQNGCWYRIEVSSEDCNGSSSGGG